MSNVRRRKAGDEPGEGAGTRVDDERDDSELSNEEYLRRLEARLDAEKDRRLPLGLHVLEKLYFRYNITSGLFMLDPWERLIFNCVAVLIIALVIFSVYRNAAFLISVTFSSS